ncbi:putative low-complexity protein [Methylophaga frappieri]|uniref:Putative low-complexity protein n=1 Tax=Methylophaga frappieri (strain ATCC BAA-2434 / DSM 25690 / JAM7) TaxID=754477 RepID=I1YHN4_METFJ|nr:pentapeptide repeat-containing protein [Methylophaga frappieri]AFJ02427.1 putative low-complexity protein [Methylophaga frappieri]
MHRLQGKWFTRHSGEVKGPFTIALLKSNLLLGRLTGETEVSQDNVNWQPLRDLPQLAELVDVFPDDVPSSQVAKHHDERDGFDRRKSATTAAQRQLRKQQRRMQEPLDRILQRQLRTRLRRHFRPKPQRWRLAATVFSLLVVSLFGLAWLYPAPFPVSESDCLTPAEPGVNWENCVFAAPDLSGKNLQQANLRNSVFATGNFMNSNLHSADLMYSDLSRADLSYTDLRAARLKGADLRQTDLQNSQLQSSDLSFADLTGARIGGADFTGAVLSGTIWINGQTCHQGSVGVCLPSPDN